MAGDNTRTIKIKFSGDDADLKRAAVGAGIAIKSFSTEAGKSASGFSGFTKSVNDFGDSISNLAPKARIVGAVTEAISTLNKAGPAVTTMAGALGLVPGAVAVAASSMVVLKLGSAGVQTAFKGVSDAASKSVSATFQKDLVPAAKAVRDTFKQTTPELDAVAAGFSRVIDNVAQTVHSSANIGSLNVILGSTKTFVTNIGAAFGPLISAILTLGRVAAPIFASLFTGAGAWAERLNVKVQTLANNGTLAKWINNGIAKFEELAHHAETDLKKIFDALKPLASVKVTLFQNLGPAFFAVLDAIGNFVGAHPALGNWIVGVALALQVLGPAIKGLSSAMQLLSSGWIGLIVIAVAALTAGFIYLWHTSSGFRVFWINLWHDILAAVRVVTTWFESAVVPIFVAVYNRVAAVIDAFKALWGAFWSSWFGAIAKAGLDFMWAYVQVIFGLIVTFFVSVWDIVKGIFVGAWDVIKGIVSGALQVLQGLFDIFAGIFSGNWSRVWQGVREVFRGIWTEITGIFNGVAAVFGGISGAIGNAVGGIANAVGGMVNAVGGYFGRMLSAAGSLASSLGGVFSGIGGAIVGGLKAAINAAVGVINGLINGINGLTGVVGIPRIPDIPRLANGGDVTRNHAYLVGDGGGPEIFVPGQSGRVVGTQDTADLLAGGQGGDLHLTIDLGAGITKRIQISNRDLVRAVTSGTGLAR